MFTSETLKRLNRSGLGIMTNIVWRESRFMCGVNFFLKEEKWLQTWYKYYNYSISSRTWHPFINWMIFIDYYKIAYIYEFSNTQFYINFLETGTSYRCFICIVWRLRFSGFILYPAFMFFTVSLKRESLNLTMKVPFIYRDSMMINIDERCFTSYKYVYSLS